MKPHILFYSNGLAVWQGLPDISNTKLNTNYLAERYLNKSADANDIPRH